MGNEHGRRIRRLERWNRLLLGGLGAAVLLTALAGMAGDEAGTLRCRRLELIDEAGTVLAFLGTDDDGSTGLFINDDGGGLRISLSHDEEQSALYVRDGTGTIRVGVAQFAHGGGGFALHGAGSKGAAVLYHKDGGSLTFYDREGKVTHRVPEPEKPAG